MKLIIFAVVGLLIGLAAGAGPVAMRVKKEVEAERVALADSLAAADSVAHTGADHASGDPDHAEGTHQPPAVELPPEDGGAVEVQMAMADAGTSGAGTEAETPDLETEADQAVGSPEEPAGDESASASGESPGAGAGPTAEVPGEPGVSSEGARRLAKVFSVMKPADASRVLAELSDREVEAILIQLGDRAAGKILSNFPAERAANLSRMVLGGNGGQP